MSTHIDPDRAASIAKFQADMAAYNERHARAAKNASAFWRHYRRNDNTVHPPKSPTASFFKPYYAGGHRMVIDGVPIRLAAHVKDWSPRARTVLGKGTVGYKEQQELERQALALGLVRPEPAPDVWDDGDYSCTQCHKLFNVFRGIAGIVPSFHRCIAVEREAGVYTQEQYDAAREVAA